MGDPMSVSDRIDDSLPQPPASSKAEKLSGRPAPGKPSGGSKLLRLLIVACAFGAGWLLAGGNFTSRHEKEALPPMAGADDGDAVMVTVEPVSYRAIQRTVEAVGTLHGFEEVVISAKVEGRVKKLHHDVADDVKPGEVLLEIDPTDYLLSVEQAERALQVELAKLGLEEPPTSGIDLEQVPSVQQARSRMENARSRYDRLRRVGVSGAISPEEVDNASSDYQAGQAEYANQLLLARAGLATVRMKQAELAVTKQQLKDAKVLAPVPSDAFPGDRANLAYAVTERRAAEGALVRPGTELFKLVIDRTLKLRVPVPGRHTGEVRVGQNVDVFTAPSSRPVTGTVARINPAVDPQTRTFEVEIQVPNYRGELKSGSFAKAAIQTRLDEKAITVPLEALVQFAGITKVFLVEDNRAKEVPVTLGVQTTEWVEIVDPALPARAKVVTSGQTAIATDTRVSVRAPANQTTKGFAAADQP